MEKRQDWKMCARKRLMKTSNKKITAFVTNAEKEKLSPDRSSQVHAYGSDKDMQNAEMDKPNKKHIWFYGLFNEQTLNYDRYLWSHWINFLRRNSEWHSNFTISKVEGFIYAEISVPSRNHSSISTNKQLKCRFSLTCFFSSVTKPSGKTLFIIHWKQSE